MAIGPEDIFFVVDGELVNMFFRVIETVPNHIIAEETLNVDGEWYEKP